MPAAIEVRRVWKAFHDRRTSGTVLALEDVSFDVADGEFVVLVGPSGCGKTTLLRAIAGLQRLSSGVVRIGGELASEGRRILIAPERRRVGMLFQGGALWPHMTVRDTLAFVLRARGTLSTALVARGVSDGAPARLSLERG